jgi:hypothetical protein
MLKQFYRGVANVEELLASLTSSERALAIALARPRSLKEDKAARREQNRELFQALVKHLAEKWRSNDREKLHAKRDGGHSPNE